MPSPVLTKPRPVAAPVRRLNYTLAELLALPRAEQDEIVRLQAELAARTDGV